MTTFNNVTVVKKANIYFDGQVSSRTVQFVDGTTKTLGLMLPGEYSLDVLLPGNEQWLAIKAGESFEVPANSKFDLKIKTPTDYCCSYIK
jgi:uncharacterized protein YaiE (UPF0345 family)